MSQQTPEDKLTEIAVRNTSVVRFNRMAFTNALLAALVFGSVAFTAISASSRAAPPLYVPADGEMRYEAPLPKTVHNKSDSELATFAANVITDTFSFDWFNATNQLNRQVKNFTNDGWMELKFNLEQSEILRLVQDDRLILSLQPLDTPVVLNKGVEQVNGENVAFWTVRMNARLLFVNSSAGAAKRNQNAEITLRAIRVSTMESDSGVAINRTNIRFK